MFTNRRTLRLWLAGMVAAHLGVAIVHGGAHDLAQVPLSRAGTLFVFIVIVLTPVAGAVLLWPAERVGAWVVALAMTGAFAFGLVNHFILAGPDHVSQVAPPWQAGFAVTAGLLALTEALAAALGLRLAARSGRLS